MSTPNLVEAFYGRIWNAGDLAATADLIAEEFSLHGSLARNCPGEKHSQRMFGRFERL